MSTETYNDLTRADLHTPKVIHLRHWCEFGKHGLSYQSCRFCRKGLGDFRGLWKYAVRHYICEGCYKFQTGKDALAHP